MLTFLSKFGDRSVNDFEEGKQNQFSAFDYDALFNKKGYCRQGGDSTSGAKNESVDWSSMIVEDQIEELGFEVVGECSDYSVITDKNLRADLTAEIYEVREFFLTLSSMHLSV